MLACCRTDLVYLSSKFINNVRDETVTIDLCPSCFGFSVYASAYGGRIYVTNSSGTNVFICFSVCDRHFWEMTGICKEKVLRVPDITPYFLTMFSHDTPELGVPSGPQMGDVAQLHTWKVPSAN